MIKRVFSMEGSRETKIECFLKERSILGGFLEVLDFQVKAHQWCFNHGVWKLEGDAVWAFCSKRVSKSWLMENSP